MDNDRDFVEEVVAESTALNPDFPQLLAAAERGRELMRELAEARERAGLTQSELAKRIGTSQPAIARLEAGSADPRLSTVERYAQAVGRRLQTA